MNIRVFILFLSILIFSSKIRADIHIIYVDCSKTERLDMLKKELKKININSNDKILFFISNGYKPIIFNDLFELNDNLKKLNYLSPSEPHFFDDLDSLNSIISLSNLFKINNTNADKIHLHFFLNYKLFKDRTMDQYFIQKFLLSNQLDISKNLNGKISVDIYLDKINIYEAENYIKNFKNTKNYVIYEY